jgi:4-hydroxythreonine-4-phosphate dehydrogenase
MGDPTGIGPEIIVKTLADQTITEICRPVVLGDLAALERALSVTGVRLRLNVLNGDALPERMEPGTLPLRTFSSLGPADLAYGRPTAASGEAMYRYITEAARLCLEGKAAAMATGPINKEAMNQAGHRYPGHTELLAELSHTEEYVMMLAGDRLRVALVTIHEQLAAVPRLVTRDRVVSTLRVVHRDLSRYLGRTPRIAVCALNPHCGEGGLFGDEEARVIVPAIAEARRDGIVAEGPLSADTLFYIAVQGKYDVVVCMYHDQGLIPLKLLHFDDGVNVTLGLPFIRTSVDHGTAYDLAGTGQASPGSMSAAIRMAAEMATVKARCEGASPGAGTE